MRMGSPISRTRMSPCDPITNPCKTRATASLVIMKKRLMSGCVIVSACFFSSWCCSVGTTLPLEPSTFPKRTDTQRMPFAGRDATISSHTRFVAPMILVGLTALSEEMSTKLPQPASSARSSSAGKLSTLFRIASCAFDSIIGTCL